MFACDEVVDHAGLQRAGPEQRHQCYEVIKMIRPQAFDQVPHTTGLKLEYRDGAWVRLGPQ